jgi:hypothetical protein
MKIVYALLATLILSKFLYVQIFDSALLQVITVNTTSNLRRLLNKDGLVPL